MVTRDMRRKQVDLTVDAEVPIGEFFGTNAQSVGRMKPYLLTSSANGNPRRRQIADLMVERAPEPAEWRFYSSRPARPAPSAALLSGGGRDLRHQRASLFPWSDPSAEGSICGSRVTRAGIQEAETVGPTGPVTTVRDGVRNGRRSRARLACNWRSGRSCAGRRSPIEGAKRDEEEDRYPPTR